MGIVIRGGVFILSAQFPEIDKKYFSVWESSTAENAPDKLKLSIWHQKLDPSPARNALNLVKP